MYLHRFAEEFRPRGAGVCHAGCPQGRSHCRGGAPSTREPNLLSGQFGRLVLALESQKDAGRAGPPVEDCRILNSPGLGQFTHAQQIVEGLGPVAGECSHSASVMEKHRDLIAKRSLTGLLERQLIEAVLA